VISILVTWVWTGSPYVVPSAMSKAALNVMTKSLAVEWGRYGIRLNAIAPGPFPTEGAWSRLMPTEEIQGLFERRIPLGRVGRHEELANLASYLLSDQASFISGDLVYIDGGEHSYGAGEFNVLDAVPGQTWDAMEAERKRRR
jgi:NAD(P)-dependent dehydrogenase (short-subunit alcohol dehydrogenase family)